MILVIYDAKNDRAWWIYLNETLRQKGLAGTATLTIDIPLANVLDVKAVRKFRRLRDACRRIWESDA